MGIQGLTTYVSERSSLLFEDYELHNTPVIIDGNAFCSVLFNASLSPNSSFGGDYDHFAHSIRDVFERFLSVGVKPIVVFDGGYEKKKLKTVIKRNEQKVLSLENISPRNIHKYCFPLLMREALKQTVKSLGLIALQSDFEADSEIAALGKMLNAPVISNDSDFYIFDVLYLPLSSFELSGGLKVSKDEGKKFIKCQIYLVDKFLESLGHPASDKSLLPLLAVLLGNDFINRSTFLQFYGRIKKPRGKNSVTQAHISGLFKWLKQNSVESAYRLVLECLPKSRRDTTAEVMTKIIQSYSDPQSCLHKYLPPDLIPLTSAENENVLCNKLSQLPSSLSFKSIDSDDDADFEETESGPPLSLTTESDPSLPVKSMWYSDPFRNIALNSAIYTLISLKIYFSVPQIEDYAQFSASDVSFHLFKILAGLVVGSETVTYYTRHRSRYVKISVSPITTSPTLGPLPSFSSLNSQTKEWKELLLLESLGIKSKDEVNNIPDDWKLMLCTFSYWVNNSSLKVFNVLNGLLMLVIVKVVGIKLGYYRNKKIFLRKYGSKLNTITKDKGFIKNMPTLSEEGLAVALSNVSLEDCIFFFEKMLPLFHLSDKLKGNPRSFSRAIVHTSAQLQSCIELSNMLNSTLGSPYIPIVISEFINSTLYYNLVCMTKRVPNLIGHLESLLMKVPSLFEVFRELCKIISNTTSFDLLTHRSRKSRRKKRNCKESSSELSDEANEDIDSENQ